MKYSNEIVSEITNYIRAGNTQHDAAVLAGISDETFHVWKREKSDFSEALKKAEQVCKSRNIAIIQKAAEKTWQAAAWWLERKYHQEFALKNIQELVGKDGQPLQISIKLDMAGGYVPQLGAITTSSTASYTRLAQVQDTGVAQESTEDNNSINRINKTGSV